MQELTLREFNDLCDTLSFSKYTFASENQDNSYDNTSLSICCDFELMLIAYNPNAICFKNQNGFLRLGRVRSIKVRKEHPIVGFVFKIVCDSYFSKTKTVSYTFVAQYSKK